MNKQPNSSKLKTELTRKSDAWNRQGRRDSAAAGHREASSSAHTWTATHSQHKQ